MSLLVNVFIPFLITLVPLIMRFSNFLTILLWLLWSLSSLFSHRLYLFSPAKIILNIFISSLLFKFRLFLYFIILTDHYILVLHACFFPFWSLLYSFQVSATFFHRAVALIQIDSLFSHLYSPFVHSSFWIGFLISSFDLFLYYLIWSSALKLFLPFLVTLCSIYLIFSYSL